MKDIASKLCRSERAAIRLAREGDFMANNDVECAIAFAGKPRSYRFSVGIQ